MNTKPATTTAMTAIQGMHRSRWETQVRETCVPDMRTNPPPIAAIARRDRTQHGGQLSQRKFDK